MGDYFDFEDKIDIIIFLNEIFYAVSLVIFGIVFACRIAQNLRQRYFDILKISQLLLVLTISLRSIIWIILWLTTNKNQTEMFLSIFNNIMLGRLAFISFIQFSWYILVKHLQIYGMMANGVSFSDSNFKIKNIERIGVLLLAIVNIAINLFTAIMEVIGFYLGNDLLSSTNDIISFLYSWALTIIEFYLYKNLKYFMHNSLHFYYQKYK